VTEKSGFVSWQGQELFLFRGVETGSGPYAVYSAEVTVVDFLQDKTAGA
jgi:hypothetical protein